MADMCVNEYTKLVSYHTVRIAECPLKVLGDFPLEYYHRSGYSPKQCACAVLVNDFGLTRLLISHSRGELRHTSKTGLMIAANLPFVDPVSDIDEFIHPGYKK